MTRIAVFWLASAMVAASGVPASGGDAGKLKAAGTLTNKQIQPQSEGNPNRPIIIGSQYNAGGTPKVQPRKLGQERAPQH